MQNMAQETGTKVQFNWKTSAHEPQRLLVEKSLKNQRLAHAYIFSGPAEAEILEFSRDLARFLVCEQQSGCGVCGNCKTIAAGSNADFMEISGDDGIKIESIRDLVYKLSLKPYSAAYKVAIINNAHTMTAEAANALLKSLEEPKPNTVLILVTDNVYKLLPTISSRAQKIHFSEIVAQGKKENDLDAQEILEAADSFSRKSLGEKLVLAAELAEKESTEIKLFLDALLRKMQLMLRQDPSTTQAARIKATMRAQRLLDQNVNSKLLLSELMVSSN